MQHFFYGGNRDGEPCPASCRDFVLTPERTDDLVASLNDMNDPEFAIPYKEIKWIHAIIRNRTQTKHVYIREDIHSKLVLR